MRLTELLQQINQKHRTTFALIERYASGEQGAFALIDEMGRQYILKWRPGSQHINQFLYAKRVTDHLRNRGYPAPEYLFLGIAFDGTYSVQTALPGSPMHFLTDHFLPQVLELHKFHIGEALSGPRDWPKEVVNTVLYGGDGYCLHSSLLHHSHSTAQLLRELQTLVLRHRNGVTGANDIVHFDFQPSNLLVQNSDISGVVDWEATCAGDGAFDLATLLFYTYDNTHLREQLWQYALVRTSLNVLSMYLAHLILRQVDWSLRHHDKMTSDRYLSRGYTLLQDITYRSRYVC